MDSTKLIKSGIDTVESLVAYLAKDAIGGEFLKQYLSSREAQAQAAEKQQNALQKLLEGTAEMEAGNREISSGAEQNIQRLGMIAEAIKSLRDSVDRIEQEQKKYTEQFANLIEQAQIINKQIDDIQNISAQTNLLSFNASIEAARAGNAGKGFRVIANEVKKLSEGTNKTSEEIKRNVENLVSSISKLEKATKVNASSLDGLAQETQETLNTFAAVREANTANNMNISKIGAVIDSNTQGINDIIKNVQLVEKQNESNLKLFVKCASDNEMLFNDLYSLVYELKAIFTDLKSQE